MAQGFKTGGRQAGTPNRNTGAIKEAAQRYGVEIIEELARLALKSDNERTRVAACSELLDRAYGKPAQAIIGGDEDDPAITIKGLIDLVRPNTGS